MASDETVGLTTEQEAEARAKEREDWLMHEEQRLFQRQQKLQTVRPADSHVKVANRTCRDWCGR